MHNNDNRVYEAPSPIHGMGIFARRDFRAGERVVEIDDTTVVPGGSPATDENGQRVYYDDISGGRVVRLGPLQYTNHSCDFTTYTKTIDGVRYRIARRDIQAGDEITSHYCINARFEGAWECNCGSSRCLGRLVHNYFALPIHLQLEYLPLLDDWFVEENREMVEQLSMYAFVESTMRQAGKVLLQHYRKPDLVIEAKGVDDLVTEADRVSEAVLIAAIRERFPDHGIVSEESGRVFGTSQYVWRLDPLEATYNFSRGLPMWGINIALGTEVEVQIGAFFDPLLDELYYAERSNGAYRNGTPIRTSGLEDLREAAIYCSTRKLVDLLHGQVRKFRHIGSIGNALAYVAAGHLDGAIEVGGGPWDYAAGELLVREAGGMVSVLGETGPESTLSVIAAASPALHAELRMLLSV